jgi:hypothetical protein
MQPEIANLSPRFDFRIEGSLLYYVGCRVCMSQNCLSDHMCLGTLAMKLVLFSLIKYDRCHDTHGQILILYMASVRLKKVVGYNLKKVILSKG